MNMQRLKHWGQIGLITVVVIGVFAGGSVHAKVYEKSQDSRSSQNSAEGKNGQPGSKKGDTNFISAGATLVADQIEDINKPWWKKGWDLVKDYTKMVGAYVEDKAKQVWDGGVAAAKWTGDKIVAGYQAVKKFSLESFDTVSSLANGLKKWYSKKELFGGSRDYLSSNSKDFKLDISRQKQLIEKTKLLSKSSLFFKLQHPDANRVSDELMRLLDARDKAYISQDVYFDDNPNKDKLALMGWQKLTGRDLISKGLKDEDFRIPGSDFRAGLYYKSETNTYIVAFKGTTTAEDWKNNLEQGAGFKSPYYEKAQELSALAARNLEPQGNVESTGHSLGGGMSTYFCINISVKCTVFNPAGLSGTSIDNAHQATWRVHFDNPLNIIRKEPKNSELVNVIRVKGEALTSAQDFSGLTPNTVGDKITIDATDEKGRDSKLLDVNVKEKHLQYIVIQSLESQISEDENYLNSISNN